MVEINTGARRIVTAETFRDRTAAFINSLNERIRENCMRLMVPCVDISKALASPERRDLLDPRYAIGDNAHLNIDGHRRVARAFYELYFRDAPKFDVVVCIGDSHTQGFPVRDETRNGVPIEIDVDSPHQYPYWLAKETGRTFINRGIAGNTFYGIRNRFENEVISHFPDHCCIQGGTNDSLLGFSLDESMEDLMFLIRRCLEAEITPVVGTTPPLGF
ncbi:MAG: GDSL-type esterase/lipase family protein [Thermoplasmatota archaeon]